MGISFGSYSEPGPQGNHGAEASPWYEMMIASACLNCDGGGVCK